ncbi:glycine betaine ABC transporter substrate-binding protein [Homoserinimonas aerilata]|nr:glycine betaine ABC transporter substrate-binding protein [Homoserinimonas aerilata]
MTSIAVGAVALLGLTACAGSADTGDNGSGDGDSKSLTVGVFNGWPEGEAASYLWKAVLEEKGYDVTLEYADAGPVFAGLSTGDYDVAFDGWLPLTHQSYMDEYGDSLEDLGSWNDDAVLTVAVNEDAPITSLDELADHADEFGNRIVGIEPGAGLTKAVGEQTIPTYGLDGMEFLTSSTPAMLSELSAALDAGENVAVTLWRPHWAYDEYPIRDLEDPEGTLGASEGIHSIARSGFGDEFSELAGWIGDWKLDSELLYSLENAMYNSGADASEYESIVADWIAENQEYVDGLTS